MRSKPRFARTTGRWASSSVSRTNRSAGSSANYPKHGDRFNEDGVWYCTLGWEACREGIDDARYLQTLVEALEAKRGLGRQQAVGAVEKILAPVDVSYASIGRVRDVFGTYGGMRQRIIREILELQ